MSQRRSPLGLVFGVANGLIALLVLFGVFAGLHLRYWVVDLPAVAIALVLAVSCFGLLRATSWSLIALRISATVSLGFGLLVVLALALSAGYLSGVQGGLGARGGIVLILICALVAPYLVIYPAAQLLWVRVQQRAHQGM